MSTIETSTSLIPCQLIPAGIGIAPSTAAKRRERFNHFARWCQGRELCALPTTASVLARYVHEQAGEIAYFTSRTRVEAVKAVHLAAGHGWLEDDMPVRQALEAVRAAGGTHASRPLVERDLVDLANDIARDGDHDAVRDWALIALGAAAGLDGRALANLRLDDLTIDVDGLALHGYAGPWNHALRVGRDLDATRCPVMALEVWLVLRDPQAQAVFHLRDEEGRVLAMRAVDVTAIVRRRMHAIGRDSRRYGAGSLKAHRFFGRGLGASA